MMRPQGDFQTRASVLAEVHGNRLYKTGLGDEEIAGFESISSGAEFLRLIEGELGQRNVTTAQLRLKTPAQNAVRFLIFLAHEVLLGNAPPKPLVGIDCFEALVEIVRHHHARPAGLRLVPVDPPRAAPQSVIYFIQAEDTPFVKIGVSKGNATRLREMQVGCPMPLTLLATCDGGRDKEKELHQRFQHLRVRGEWFRLERELEAFIEHLSMEP